MRKFFDLRSAKFRNNYQESKRHAPIPETAGGALKYFHPSMKGVSEAVWLYGVHEPKTTSVYLDHVHSGENVIEIGANIGYYVLLARSVVGDSGSVLGFEPVPDNFVVLRKNVADFDNVQVSQLVISNENEVADFYVSDIPNWGSLIYTDGLQMTGSLSIEGVRLDDYLAEKENYSPSLIHMDIEGGEINALEGAWQTISNYTPKLMVEFHPFITGFDPVRNLLVRFQSLGYQQCIQIDRQVDEPWIPTWLRRLRKGKTSVGELVRSIDSRKCPANFTVLLLPPKPTN